MNDVKCILHSSNQTYMTVYIIFGGTGEPNSKIKYLFYFRRGVKFAQFFEKSVIQKIKFIKNAQEMGVEAGQIRIPHEILMKNSYFPASIFDRVDRCFASLHFTSLV